MYVLPVFAGGTSFFLAEDSDEVRQVVESAGETYFSNAVCGVEKHLTGVTDTQVVDIVDKGTSGFFFEKVAESGFRHA